MHNFIIIYSVINNFEQFTFFTQNIYCEERNVYFDGSKCFYWIFHESKIENLFINVNSYECKSTAIYHPAISMWINIISLSRI